MTTDQGHQRVDIGADVVDVDDNKLGTVAYVVVHPSDLNITNVVVSTGALLGRDIVMPIDLIAEVQGDVVHLSADKETIERCPDYVEYEYSSPPNGWVAPADFGYPMGSIMWPSQTYLGGLSSAKVNSPAGTVGLSEGIEVMSSDGKNVGSLTQVDRDESSGEIASITIKHGLIHHHVATIPADAIGEVTDTAVRLTLTEQQVEELARHDDEKGN